MSTRKPKIKKSAKTPASIVWFDIPADNLERAKKFYSKMFGWKIGPFAGMPDYLHIDTAGANDTPNGGLIARKSPQQGITNYVSVPSVSKALAKAEKLGGRTCMPKTTVPGMGYFAIFVDTEGNGMAVWEMNGKAK